MLCKLKQTFMIAVRYKIPLPKDNSKYVCFEFECSVVGNILKFIYNYKITIEILRLNGIVRSSDIMTY